ncbi:MAG: sulfate transporter CysZ, partial [Gammaproteobacteria bacterium]
LWPMFALMIIFIVFYGFTFVANIIAAPFNSLLAEKVEAKLLGRPYENTSVIPLWSMVRHSLMSSLHSVMYMLLWSLLILIISFIPLINVAAPVLWFVFGAWMLALEYLDYPLGNHQHFFSDVKAWAKNNSMLSLSFGSGVFVITNIPLLNFIAMPAAVAAATALWLQREKS